MGEYKRRNKRLAEMLKAEPRCIYCPNPASTIEHMPPISMFRDRDRLRGMEFASCVACNTGTKAADEAAVFVSHIHPFGMTDDWQFQTMLKMGNTLEQHAPGFNAELFRPENVKDDWRRDPGGILRRVKVINADGPILKRHLRVFAAKLGMALYRQHIGIALPLHGGVYVAHFLNAGLSEKSAKAMLSMMPISGELKMGIRSSKSQFAYRYNTDEKSIVAALVGFHSHFHCLIVATSELATYGPALENAEQLMTLLRPEGLLSSLGN